MFEAFARVSSAGADDVSNMSPEGTYFHDLTNGQTVRSCGRIGAAPGYAFGSPCLPSRTGSRAPRR